MANEIRLADFTADQELRPLGRLLPCPEGYCTIVNIIALAWVGVNASGSRDETLRCNVSFAWLAEASAMDRGLCGFRAERL